jgi:hypothetical protein
MISRTQDEPDYDEQKTAEGHSLGSGLIPLISLSETIMTRLTI